MRPLEIPVFVTINSDTPAPAGAPENGIRAARTRPRQGQVVPALAARRSRGDALIRARGRRPQGAAAARYREVGYE